jgi:superfamily II DNA helicase RecQ
MIPHCRRQHILSYFGEDNVNCEASCDYCVSPFLVKGLLDELKKKSGMSCVSGYDINIDIIIKT